MSKKRSLRNKRPFSLSLNLCMVSKHAHNRLNTEIAPQQGIATIHKRVFLGDRIQFILALPGGHIVNTETAADSPLQEGQQVGFTIQTQNIMAALQDGA